MQKNETTTIRIQKSTKELLFGVKGGRTADQYIRECVLYFKICRYDPRDMTANPVLDISILFNRKTDQLKGMLVNFQKENNIRFDKVENLIFERLEKSTSVPTNDNQHIFTTDELNDINESMQLYKKKVEEDEKTISQQKNKIRMLELEKQKAPTEQNINIARLRNLCTDLQKMAKLDKFDISQSSYSVDRNSYDLRLDEILKLLKMPEW